MTEQPEVESEVADAAVVERGERIRAALAGMGVDLGLLGPAPAWLPSVRAGALVRLGANEQTELRAYLGTTSTACVASDAACAQVLERLEAVNVLREMREAGMTCLSHADRLSAGQLRSLQQELRATGHI